MAPPEPVFPWLGIGFVLLLVILYLTLQSRSVGITWDEPEHFRTAQGAAQAFRSVFELIGKGEITEAFRQFAGNATWQLHPETPMLPRYIQGVFQVLFGSLMGEPTIFRFASAFMWAVMLFFVFRLSWETYGPTSAWASILIVLSLPRLMGHGTLAATEATFLATWFAAAYVYLKAYEGKVPHWVFGFVLGLALMGKFQSVALLATLSVWAFLYQPSRSIRLFLWGAVLGPLVFVALQPLYWSHLLTQIGYFIKFNFHHFPIPLYFQGKVYSGHAPWFYAPFIFVATVPLPCLLLALIGLLKTLFSFERRRILFVWLMLVPMLLMMFKNAPTYDGERLFVQAYPAFALIATGGVQVLLSWRASLKNIFLASLAVFASFTILTTQPFFLEYYGAVVGGVKGAEKRGLESSYWLDAITPEMIDALNREVPPQGLVHCVSVQFDVLTYRQRIGTLRKDIVFIPDMRPGVTHILAYARQGFSDPVAFRALVPVAEVKFHGVSLVKLSRVVR